MRHWVLAGCLGLLGVMSLASGCGDDDEGEEGPGGEMCFQAGGLDDRCRCSDDRPMGIRRCQDNLTWSECVCPEPYDEPCMRGEVVECTCPGDDRTYTTECLGSGTYDCACDSRRAGRDGG